MTEGTKEEALPGQPHPIQVTLLDTVNSLQEQV